MYFVLRIIIKLFLSNRNIYTIHVFIDKQFLVVKRPDKRQGINYNECYSENDRVWCINWNIIL